MTNPTEAQIEKIAKHSYENERLSTDTTPWNEVSKNTRASYINEAKEQYEYLIDFLSVLGVSPASVEKFTENLSTNMEHSTKVMQENAELKAKLDQRNESIRDLKEKIKSNTKHAGEDVDNEALIKLQKKYNLLKDSFDIISDEATASADMVEKLTPLQDENKTLKEERDALEHALNKAVTHIKTKAGKKTKQSKPDPSLNKHITHVNNILNQFDNLKDGKIALCEALDIEPINLRSKTKLWISIRIKQHGWDDINEACNTIKKA